MDVTIEPYAMADDLAEVDRASVAAIFNAAWDEWIPGEPPVSVVAYTDDDRFTHEPEVRVQCVARDDAGQVVGWGHVYWRDGEPGGCVLRTAVDRGRRQASVGAAIATHLVNTARAAGRTGVTIETPLGGLADGISERAGLRPDMTVEQNRADAHGPSDELLEGWVAAGEAAAGYSFVRYDAPCPDDELATAFVQVRHVMNDAPRWEGEAEAVFTPAELRAAENAAARSNVDWWSVGVRHDAGGVLVGLSEMYLPAARPWIVFQGDTGVVPAHRGHGLGAWMKAVNHLRLRAERPAVDTIQTWNASANEPMLRINRALGFRPVQTYRGWYLPLD